MKQKKDQFIIVCLESADSAPMLMPYAKLCAEKLGKEIILMTIGNDREVHTHVISLPAAGYCPGAHEGISRSQLGEDIIPG